MNSDIPIIYCNPPAAPVVPAAATPGPDFAAPSVSYTFRLAFPNGQKDEYTLLGTRSAPQPPPNRRPRRPGN